MSIRELRIIALALSLAGTVLFAQNVNTGEIRGTVTDPSGAGIPGVAVEVINVGTGATVRTITSVTGTYAVPALPLGNYSITFTKEGFRKTTQTGIDLHVGVSSLNVAMQVGALTQEISVEAAPMLIQTESAARETSLAANMVNQLPQVGWSWQKSIALLPGISSGQGGAAAGTGVSINGTQQYQSAWLLDGNTATMPVSQNPSNTANTPMEFIAEVHVSTNNMTAQYGGGTSVFNIISKSGTNRFHGSLFEFLQNDVLNAYGYFANRNAHKPYRRWHMYGGALGGPIKKDKLFFLFSFQRNSNISYSAYYTTFPTAAMKAGDFSASGFPTIYDPNSTVYVNGVATSRSPLSGNQVPPGLRDAVSLKIQDYLPTSQTSALGNNYYYSGRNTSSNTYYNEKIDYHISSKTRLSFSGTFSNAPSHRPDPRDPMNTSNMIGREQHYQLTDVMTFNPTTLAELRLSALRAYWLPTSPNMGMGFPQKIGLKNAPADTFPTINISGTVSTSISGGTRALFYEGSYVPSGTATLVRGKHVVKFGGEYDRFYQNYTTVWGDLTSGIFGFTGIATRNPAVSGSTGVGYADFLMGQVSSWRVNNPPLMGMHSGNVQTYIQDDYKIRPNLTLQLGIRETMQFGWSEKYNRVGTFDPTIMNDKTGTLGAMWFAPANGRTALQKTKWSNWAPRVGVAWSPAPTWSVRVGYGLFDFLWGANSYTYNAFGMGLSVSGARQSADSVTPVFTLAEGPPVPLYPTNESRTPGMLNGQNIGYYFYDTPMPYSQQLQLNIQRQFPGRVAVEAAYVRTWSVHQAFTTDGNQVPVSLLGPGNAQSRRPYPQFLQILTYWFNGTSNYHGFQLSLKKQYSHGLNVVANYTWSKTMDTGSGSGWGSGGIDNYQYAYDQKANYGLSANYTPQMFNGAIVWEVPVGVGRAYLNQGGVLDYVLGGWQASTIFQMFSGRRFTPTMATNLSGALSGSWRPNRVASGILANPTIQKWFDTNAFAQPTQYTFGNSPRNVLAGPGTRSADFSLAKAFRLPLGEEGRIQVRMDATNVFNHPNFSIPNSSIGSSTAGEIRSASEARVIQLGLRLSF